MNTLWTLRHFVGAKLRWATLQGEALWHYQDQRAQAMVRWVNESSSFYHNHWQDHDLKDWRNLPTIDKRLMNEHFDTLNTVGMGKEAALQSAVRSEQERDFAPTINGYTVGLSSGTSGHRGLFVVSPYEQAAWAGTILARALHRFSLSGERVAFFLRANSNLYKSVGRGGLIRFHYFDLMTSLEETITTLNQFQPTIVSGPPSMLERLARARIEGHLRITPRQVISAAEVLEPQDKVFLESVFQVPLHQVYQATEGLIGISCKHGSLHVQSDLMAVQLEPISSTDALGPKRQRFTPILTDLWRRTQPIIRYRLNDLWLMGSHCGCGSSWPVIERVEGRTSDVLRFEGLDQRLRKLYPEDVRQMVQETSSQIQDYRVVQEQVGHLRLHLRLDQGSAKEVEALLRAKVQGLFEQWGCVLALEVEPTLPDQPANIKRRRVQVKG